MTTVVNDDAFKIENGTRPWRVHAFAASNTTPSGPLLCEEDGMGDWKEIPVCGGFVALVDEEDYERLSPFSWHMAGGGSGYPSHVLPHEPGERQIHVAMHYEIMPRKIGFMVDHISGNTLDNRRCNLRYADSKQQSWNSKKFKGTRSKYKGVSYDNSHYRKRPWRVTIMKDGKSYRNFGFFETEIEAARVYDKAAIELFGEFARLNFPLDNGKRGG